MLLLLSKVCLMMSVTARISDAVTHQPLVAGNRVELACELAPGTFAPEQNAEFHYGVWNSEDQPVRPLDLGVLEFVDRKQ